MKKLIPIVTVFLTGCVATMIPLKGTYPDKPFEVISNKSVDSVWSSVIDLFATKGLSIKVIDKSSGLIVSEKTSFINNYTFENNSGKLEKPAAWIVLAKTTNPMGGFYVPQKVLGEWNVRVKSNGNKTVINVNLTNIDASSYFAPSQYSAGGTFVFQGKSTGQFESMIADAIK